MKPILLWASRRISSSFIIRCSKMSIIKYLIICFWMVNSYKALGHLNENISLTLSKINNGDKNIDKVPVPINNLNINKIKKQEILIPLRPVSDIPDISSQDINLNDSNYLECSYAHKYCTKPDKLVLGNSFCHCNSECYKYGDCCWDADHDATDQTIRVMFECVLLNKDLNSPAYYMISHCPAHWKDNETRSFCEELDLYIDDLLLYIPVTSKSTFNVYRNIFCAMCNNVHDIVAWTPYLSCYELHQDCLTLIKPPEMFPRPKQCDWHGIFVCHHDSPSLRYKCATYYAPVQIKDSYGAISIYKNKFCAFCAGIIKDQLKCSIRSILKDDYAPDLTFSFAFLLDVDFIRGGSIVGNKKKCLEGYIFDPWKKKCRNIFCGRLFHYKDGKCIKLSNIVENPDLIWYNRTFDSDCNKISIERDLYVIYENGTVMILDGTIFEPGNYELNSNDSILVCGREKYNNMKKFSQEQEYLTKICLSISVSCLAVKILLFIIVDEDRKLSTVLIFFLSLSLFFAQFLFLVGQTEIYKSICIGIAIFTHYFFLSYIFCINVLAFDIWKTFSSLNTISNRYSAKYLLYYSIYCWGIPLIIVISAILNEWAFPSKFSPNYGLPLCWISNRFALLIFFVIPLGLIIIINSAFYVITIVSIVSTSKSTKLARENINKKNHFRFALYVKLALIMGLSWIFGFISAYSNSDVLWNLFIILNGLQGAFILVAFTRINTFKKFFNKISVKEKIYNCGLKISHISKACFINKIPNS